MYVVPSEGTTGLGDISVGKSLLAVSDEECTEQLLVLSNASASAAYQLRSILQDADWDLKICGA